MSAPAAVAVAEPCFHCGLPVPAATTFSVELDGEVRPLCCAGCQAVAETIVASGLADFYRHRSAPPQRPEDLVPEPLLREWALYDRPELQKSFVRTAGAPLREASLILEGITCAACAWLNERHVGALPGVVEFRVNYATHRAVLRWDERQVRLSDVLAAIAAIGYRAHPFDPGRQASLQQQERTAALKRVAVAGLGAAQVMMLATALYLGAYQGIEESTRQLLRWMCLLVTLPVVFYAARPFFASAWGNLRHRRLGMDVPVALALGGAFLASAWHTWRGAGEVYFDSVTMFTFLLLGARYLEMSARHQAGRISEERVRLLPVAAVRLGPGDADEIVAAAELAPGERVWIRPGETVPADGRVLEGASSVDESLLTGESLPLPKAPGDALIGGSVNVESPLIMRVEQVGADTVVAAITRLLDRAQSEKPGIARLADRVAGAFVGALLLIAAGVFAWWWPQAPDNALAATLAVLVVSCPCALSLATPAAITAATGALTRAGLLATRGHALETLARATHVVFDKTGTLTHGRLRLTAVVPRREPDARRCLALAAALERGSEHPLGRAIMAAARLGETVHPPPQPSPARGEGAQAEGLKNVPGEGVEGTIGGLRYRLGRPEFVAALGGSAPWSNERDEAGVTRVALGDERGLLAWLELADELRPEAAAAVAELQALGLTVILLSGDRPATVQYVARRLGIAQAEGDLRPRDKLERIRKLQAQGAVVAMVGDGVNDAPVLAGAAVSLAMGGGTALAQVSADMILLADNLKLVTRGLKEARRTLAIVRQNVVWAVTYNVLAVPLAATGWIAPWTAALGMSLSSLLVVGNALRLRDGREPNEDRPFATRAAS